MNSIGKMKSWNEIRKAAMGALPKLEPEDHAAGVESWPKAYARILNGESATMLAMDMAEGK